MSPEFQHKVHTKTEARVQLCSPKGFSILVSTPFWASPHHQRMLSPLGKPAQDKLQQACAQKTLRPTFRITSSCCGEIFA